MQPAAAHSLLHPCRMADWFACLAEPPCGHALVHCLQPHSIVSPNEGFTHGGGLKLLVVVFDCISSLLHRGATSTQLGNSNRRPLRQSQSVSSIADSASRGKRQPEAPSIWFTSGFSYKLSLGGDWNNDQAVTPCLWPAWILKPKCPEATLVSMQSVTKGTETAPVAWQCGQTLLHLCRYQNGP